MFQPFDGGGDHGLAKSGNGSGTPGAAGSGVMHAGYAVDRQPAVPRPCHLDLKRMAPSILTRHLSPRPSHPYIGRTHEFHPDSCGSAERLSRRVHPLGPGGPRSAGLPSTRSRRRSWRRGWSGGRRGPATGSPSPFSTRMTASPGPPSASARPGGATSSARRSPPTCGASGSRGPAPPASPGPRWSAASATWPMPCSRAPTAGCSTARTPSARSPPCPWTTSGTWPWPSAGTPSSCRRPSRWPGR